MNGLLRSHEEHPWQQVGRCVYCGPCKLRLFQGRVPDGHPIYVPPKVPTPADKMREKWGK